MQSDIEIVAKVVNPVLLLDKIKACLRESTPWALVVLEYLRQHHK